MAKFQSGQIVRTKLDKKICMVIAQGPIVRCGDIFEVKFDSEKPGVMIYEFELEEIKDE